MTASAPSTEHAAVLFDVDGTLVDSTYHHAVAWQRAFDRQHLPMPLWRIHRAVGMGGDKLVAHVAGDEVEAQHGDALRTAWQGEYAELEAEVLPLPGATELVRGLVASGVSVALASSGEPDFTKHAVGSLEVGDDVAVVTTSADVDGSKPDPDLVRGHAGPAPRAGPGAGRGDGGRHAVRRGGRRARTACAAWPCDPGATPRPSCARPAPPRSWTRPRT